MLAFGTTALINQLKACFFTHCVILKHLSFHFLDISKIESHPNWQFLDTNKCGFARTDTSNRIIRGETAALGQFPWIVRMGQQNGDSVVYDCAGTLLNQHYVVTVVHCGARHWVRLGENNIGQDPDCDDTGCAPPVQDIPIAENLFSKYDYITYRNDVMLSRLEFPAKYNEFVQPICLPFGSLLTKNVLGSYVQIAGWGSINPTQQVYPNSLMYLNAPILDIDICRNAFDDFRKPDPEMQYCAGYTEEMKGSCFGDSGGPMTIFENVNGVRRHFLLGIVSYGFNVCASGPAVYTRVIHYLPDLLNSITQ
nr:unnamed protein product [Callosobruchus analis]